MMKRFFRGMFYLLLAIAFIFFAFALAIELGVRTVPIWPDYVLDLPFRSDGPMRIGMLLTAISALFYMGSRFRPPVRD